MGAWKICLRWSDALTVFGCEIVFLQTLDPSGFLSFQISKSEQPCQGRVVGAQVDLLSMQTHENALVSSKWPTTLRVTVISLGLGQSFAEIGHNPFTAILYLGQ